MHILRLPADCKFFTFKCGVNVSLKKSLLSTNIRLQHIWTSKYQKLQKILKHNKNANKYFGKGTRAWQRMGIVSLFWLHFFKIFAFHFLKTMVYMCTKQQKARKMARYFLGLVYGKILFVIQREFANCWQTGII